MNYGSNQQTSTATPQPVKAPIVVAVEGMDATTNRLHERLSMLENRLAAVLAPQPPQGVGDTQGKLARHSLALQLDSANASIAGACDRIDSIINRLEL